MKQNAVILADGMLQSPFAKTTHGLITGLSRYNILGVIDHKHSGKDAGYVIDGISRNIPIFASLPEALTRIKNKIDYCVIGIATHGGVLTTSLKNSIITAIENKLNIVNGLHDILSEDPQLNLLARQNQVELIDLRRPKLGKYLHMWSGKILQVTTPRIAVLGTDCGIGKRTTCQLIYQQAINLGIKVQMIYTGQTGWLQGFKYGFILDSTLNDFVSGELEHAIVSCEQNESPQLILVEGQSALFNPSGPCGSEFILSAGIKGVILQHTYNKNEYLHGPNFKTPMPGLAKEIELINLYGANVLAITVNTSCVNDEDLNFVKQQVRQELSIVNKDIPIICPREEGVSQLIPIVDKYMCKQKEVDYAD